MTSRSGRSLSCSGWYVGEGGQVSERELSLTAVPNRYHISPPTRQFYPDYWYLAVVDIVRRLLLSSVLIVIPSLTIQLWMALFVSVFFTVGWDGVCFSGGASCWRAHLLLALFSHP